MLSCGTGNGGLMSMYANLDEVADRDDLGAVMVCLLTRSQRQTNDPCKIRVGAWNLHPPDESPQVTALVSLSDDRTDQGRVVHLGIEPGRPLTCGALSHTVGDLVRSLRDGVLNPFTRRRV